MLLLSRSVSGDTRCILTDVDTINVEIIDNHCGVEFSHIMQNDWYLEISVSISTTTFSTRAGKMNQTKVGQVYAVFHASDFPVLPNSTWVTLLNYTKSKVSASVSFI